MARKMSEDCQMWLRFSWNRPNQLKRSKVDSNCFLEGSKGHIRKGHREKRPENTLKIPWKSTLKFMVFSAFSLCSLWVCPLHLSHCFESGSQPAKLCTSAPSFYSCSGGLTALQHVHLIERTVREFTRTLLPARSVNFLLVFCQLSANFCELSVNCCYFSVNCQLILC